MSTNSFWRFFKGLIIRPETSDPSTTEPGSFWYNGTSGKFKGYINGAVREVLSNSDTQTVTGKTIDADQNTISNIENADIKAAAAIAHNKMAALDPNIVPVTDASGFIIDSAVTDTELGYLSGVTSSIQDQLDQAGTDLNDHITDATDAHDATAISFTPAGSIVATNTQAAVEEVATDAAAALSTHESDTGTHGVTTVAGLSEVQVFTNKDIDGGTASNTNRITLPKNTTANLDALTDKEGTIAYDTDLQSVVVNDGSQWNEISGGGSTTFPDDTFRIYDELDNTKELRLQLSSITTATQRTWTVPDANGSVVLDGAGQTLSNKTLDNSNTITVKDTLFTIQDDGDATKQVKFATNAGHPGGQTQTYTFPNALSSTLLGTDTSQTVSNKDIDNSNLVSVKDANFTIQDDSDTTKQAKFQASGITTATTRTYTLPNASGTLVLDSSLASTIQVLTSGSGTYTTPANARRLRIRMIGAGGGGSGSGTTPGDGGAGGDTTFSTLTAGGGAGGKGDGTGCAGGTASGGDVNINGGQGCERPGGGSGFGGSGGSGAFGGSGRGGDNGAAAGKNGATNSGGGGGGGGSSGTGNPGSGGGSGAYVEKTISSPAGTYSYAVGAGGTAGTAGTGGAAGGTGGSGIIIVEEFY